MGSGPSAAEDGTAATRSGVEFPNVDYGQLTVDEFVDTVADPILHQQRVEITDDARRGAVAALHWALNRYGGNSWPTGSEAEASDEFGYRVAVEVHGYEAPREDR